MKQKIAVIGPESTGKSALSEALALQLQGVWVPEFARQYLEQLDRDYEEEDLLYIAQRQWQQEQNAGIGQGAGTVIIDTNLEVIKVWSEYKYGRCNEWILQQNAMNDYDLYLLTDIDLLWEEDPLREHPEPELRQYFFNVYKDIVVQSGIPFGIVSGSGPRRVQAALSVIQQYLH